MRPSIHPTALILLAGMLSACQTIGVGSVQRDRLDYATAIGDSWKEQALLNIVKLRYFDPPVFLDVSSVISSYTLQSQVELGTRIFRSAPQGTYKELGASGIYIDRPTIAYAPLAGEKFVNHLLRPIPPQAIFAMIQAGHQADFILQAGVRAINDVYNYSGAPARARARDPEFERVIRAFRRLQQAGALGVRVQKTRAGDVTIIFFREQVDADLGAAILDLKRALGIPDAVKELELGFGSLRHRDNELTLLTRSLMEMLVELSAGVEVPQQHLAEGRAREPNPAAAAAGPGEYPLARIRSSVTPPQDAYIAVRYRDHWFWIDDRDLSSKRVFTFLRIFSSIAETGAVPQLPLITIPAN
ncbi:MAG: hypothetical protein IT531_14240 [Burkholderiales bacterium]|nr:hypothetical protein [Burkholderiales bacterium]